MHLSGSGGVTGAAQRILINDVIPAKAGIHTLQSSADVVMFISLQDVITNG